MPNLVMKPEKAVFVQYGRQRQRTLPLLTSIWLDIDLLPCPINSYGYHVSITYWSGRANNTINNYPLEEEPYLHSFTYSIKPPAPTWRYCLLTPLTYCRPVCPNLLLKPGIPVQHLEPTTIHLDYSPHLMPICLYLRYDSYQPVLLTSLPVKPLIRRHYPLWYVSCLCEVQR